MSMSYLPPSAMSRLPLAPRSLTALTKVRCDNLSKSVSSALVFVNMQYSVVSCLSLRWNEFYFTADGLHLGDAAWVENLRFRFAGKERGDPDVVQGSSYHDMVR